VPAISVWLKDGLGPKCVAGSQAIVWQDGNSALSNQTINMAPWTDSGLPSGSVAGFGEILSPLQPFDTLLFASTTGRRWCQASNPNPINTDPGACRQHGCNPFRFKASLCSRVGSMHGIDGNACGKARLVCTGFAVPDSQFANFGSANHPGVNQSSWNTCFACGNTLDQCTKVAGSPTASDQFSLYRGPAASPHPHPEKAMIKFPSHLRCLKCAGASPTGVQLASLLAPSSDSNCSFLFNSYYAVYGVYAQQVQELHSLFSISCSTHSFKVPDSLICSVIMQGQRVTG
jgi:hypothetical protein